MTLRPYSAELQKDYRDVMGTPGAPEVVDDEQPVVPVAIVGGTVNVEVSAANALSAPSATQTPLNLSAYGVATGAAIRTVTSGKKFYCTAEWIGLNAVGGTVEIQVAGTNVFKDILAATDLRGRGLAGGILWTAASGTAITLVHGAGGAQGFYNISGFEQ